MSKKVTIKQAMELLDKHYEILDNMSEEIEKMDNEELAEHIEELQELTLDLLDEYYGVDKHLGCHNWPNCDEFGCGESGDN